MNMFFLPTEAKKSRNSLDAELNELFPRGCDVMGVATPGIVCKCSLFLSLSYFFIYEEENKISPSNQNKSCDSI